MTPENDRWFMLKRMVKEEKERSKHSITEGCHIKKGAMCQVLSWMERLETNVLDREYRGN